MREPGRNAGVEMLGTRRLLPSKNLKRRGTTGIAKTTVKGIIRAVLLTALTFFPLLCWAAQPGSEKEPLLVGTKVVAPFAMKMPSGEWRGISIDLWREIANRLGLSYRFKETETVQELMDGVADGAFSAGVAALGITSDRETRVDFTHPFYSSGLGIAVSAQGGSPWFSVIKKLLSPAFLKVVTALFLTLLGVGILVWWFERKRNSDEFGKGTARGIGSGFWWSAVTMTTVGYGDKSPVTLAGRLVALVWMFVSIIIISGFTAAITASLTVSELGTAVKGPEDLITVRVGSVPDTISAEYLAQNHVSFQKYHSVEDGLKALSHGTIDAFVYDSPVLLYLINLHFPASLAVLPQRFEQQNYGIALPGGSPLREPINRILLKDIRSKAWQDLLYRYLGRH